jgi:hypothetical protein
MLSHTTKIIQINEERLIHTRSWISREPTSKADLLKCLLVVVKSRARSEPLKTCFPSYSTPGNCQFAWLNHEILNALQSYRAI